MNIFLNFAPLLTGEYLKRPKGRAPSVAVPCTCIGCFADSGALAEGALPTGGEQGAGGQFGGGEEIIWAMVHDLVGSLDGPLRAGAFDKLEFIAARDVPFF
jgi:hypothetical protein